MVSKRPKQSAPLSFAFASGVAITLVASAAAARPEDAQVGLMQMLLPLPQDATQNELDRVVAESRRIIGQVSGCEDLRAIAQHTQGATIIDTQTVRVGDLPATIAQQIITMPIGRAIGPYRLEGAVQIVAICSREP